MSEDQQTERSLREEGNALFARKDFGGAYWIYTAAIEQDKSNPVLYANRAACLLPLGRYSEAREDSTKAVELDPNYTKAWGRLATATEELGDWKSAVEAYGKGLSTLAGSDVELSSAQKEMKGQLETRLRVAKEQAANPQQSLLIHSPESTAGSRPWDRANSLVAELQTAINNGEPEATSSSAWVIHSAYQSFAAGVKKMKNLKETVSPTGEIIYDSENGALEDLVKGILKDRRVFHMDSKDWLEDLDKQIHAESKKASVQAWLDEGSETVLAHIDECVESDGWLNASPAILTIVSAWIMRAFIAAGIGGDFDQALNFYATAIDVLERSRKHWQEFPEDRLREMFDDKFVLAVRGLYLYTFFRAVESKKSEESVGHTIQTLLELSEDYERDVKRSLRDFMSQPRTAEPSLMLTSFLYPMGEALMKKGFCYSEMAKEVEAAGELMDLMKKSFNCYMEAAKNCYPQDDERHAICLSTALNDVFTIGAPLSVVLPLIDKLKDCVPKMLRIWEYSSSALAVGPRQAHYEYVFEWEAEVRNLLNEGKLTMDNVVPATWMENNPKAPASSSIVH